MNVLRKTLTQLEGDDWGAPPSDAPPYLRECFQLRNLPIQDLNPEALRMLIGQDVGLQHLVPLAISTLERDPLVSGAHYPGDLLVAVLRANKAYFDQNQLERQSVRSLLELARSKLHTLDPIDREYTEEALEEAAHTFCAH